MKIALGSDHIGLQLKNTLKDHLLERGCEYDDFGPESDERTDYPRFAAKVARAVASGSCDLGLLVCGTGIGMSIAANKVRGIRAAACSEPYSAEFSRRHNNANILCLGARVVGPGLAQDILDAWLDAVYEGGRHQQRVDMIADLENFTEDKST